MTADQFAVLARRLGLQESASREALRLVLCEGLTQQAAAAAAGASRPRLVQTMDAARQCVKDAQVLAQLTIPGKRAARASDPLDPL